VSEGTLITAVVIAVTFALMLLCESLSPLRQSREPKLRRIARNLGTAGISLAAMTLLQAPLLVPVSRWTMENRVGLLNLVGWPAWVEILVAIVLLDYTLWWWHRANHQVPFLWRFHLPHHVDRDLDTSTALRFHFGELTLSIIYRAGQIMVIGTNPLILWLWQTILFASILFHHSNVRLPGSLERWLVLLIVTPRMHGIHHSHRMNETNSNWSSLFSCWDYLHRTLLLNVPQRDVTIGVPAYQKPEDVTVGKVLSIPFVNQRDDWRDDAGTLTIRQHEEVHRFVLAE
jgi:sterol desaturase/sphingolipid hydroxylase (fatty acid hydroxylase superfamily)